MHEVVVYDLDDLLGRIEPLEDILAQRVVLDVPQEVLHDVVVHVGLEKGETDLLESLTDVLGPKLALAAQATESAL